jgi:hypothetical protein
LSPGRPRTQLLVERPPRLSDRVRNLADKRVGKQFDFGIAGPPGVSFARLLFARATNFHCFRWLTPRSGQWPGGQKSDIRSQMVKCQLCAMALARSF